MANPTWRRPDFQQAVLDVIGDPDVWDGVADTMGTVAATAQGTAAVLRELQMFLAAGDPLSMLLIAGGAAVGDMVASLQEADFYAYAFAPKSWGDLIRPYTMTDAMTELAASVNDPLDGSRPQFGADDAFCSLTLAVGADNWLDFGQLLEDFAAVFNMGMLTQWQHFANMRWNYQRYRDNPIPRPDRNSHGAPRDWWRANLQDVLPGVGEALEYLYDMIDAVGAFSRAVGDQVSALAEDLVEKAEALRVLAEDLRALAELIARLHELVPRMKYLYCSGERGGTNGFVGSVINAGAKPEFKLMAGVTFAFFGPNPGAYLDTFLQLVGLQVTRTEIAADRIAMQVEQ